MVWPDQLARVCARGLAAVASHLKLRGRHGVAEQLARQALADASASLGRNDPGVVQLLNAAGLLFTYAGQFDEAEQLYRRALLLADPRGGLLAENEPHTGAAVEAHTKQGECSSAVAADRARLGAILEALASARAAERQLSQATRVLEHAVALGDPEAVAAVNKPTANRQGNDAIADAEPPDHPGLAITPTAGPAGAARDQPELATTLNNLATLLELRGQHEEATELYRRAVIILEHTLGHHPNQRMWQANDTALSPREREVVVLVARGLTNREIATDLRITERTAGAHVEHILGKLGFTSRTQIAVWATEHGLVHPPQVE